MKFQNCILINFERTDARTDKPKAIYPFNFSKIDIIKIGGWVKYIKNTARGPIMRKFMKQALVHFMSKLNKEIVFCFIPWSISIHKLCYEPDWKILIDKVILD